jgi:glycosyltransferase involved in cell wall biosynthesis
MTNNWMRTRVALQRSAIGLLTPHHRRTIATLRRQITRTRNGDREQHGRDPSVLFLFNGVREAQVRGGAVRSSPRHTLSVFFSLGEHGLRSRYVRCAPSCEDLLLRHPRLWMLYTNALAALTCRAGDGVVFATHEYACLLALALRRVRLLRQPLIVVNVALLRDSGATRRFIWRHLLPGADMVLSYSAHQPAELSKVFGLPPACQRVLPLAIDYRYFAKDVAGYPAARRTPRTPTHYVLSSGTNVGRDYVTFIKAMLLLEGAQARIVCDQRNLDVIRVAFPNLPARFKFQLSTLPYREITHLYQRASVGVVSLHDVRFSTGQTTVLELMACGTPTVVSDVSGIADYITHMESALVVPPGDEVALANAIGRLLKDPKLAARLTVNAERRVIDRFTLEVGAAVVARTVRDLLIDRPARTRGQPPEGLPHGR